MPRIHYALLGFLLMLGLTYSSVPADVLNCQTGCDPRNSADYSEKQYLWLSSDEWKKCDWESVQQFPDRYSCDAIACHSVSLCEAGCWGRINDPSITTVTQEQADESITLHRQALAAVSSLPAITCGNKTEWYSGAAYHEFVIANMLYYGKKSYSAAGSEYVAAAGYMEDAYDNGFTKVPYAGASSHPMSLAGMYYRYAGKSYCEAGMVSEAQAQFDNAWRVYRVAGYTEEHLGSLIEECEGDATTSGTATPPPAAELTKLSGRIFYSDYKEAAAYTRIGFAETEERGMPYMNYSFTYGSTQINGSTDAEGRYSITFTPALKLVAGTSGEFRAKYADRDGKLIVSSGTDKGADGLYTTKYGGYFSFSTFEPAPDADSGEASFDFNLNGSTSMEYAKIYYNTYYALNYAEEVLGEPMDKSAPLMVYVTPEGDTAYHVSGYGIAIGDDCAVFGYPDAPLNREWHETGHRVQYDGFGQMPRVQGDTNHGSYRNPSSTDSLKEGWAESFAAMVSKFRGSQYPNLYPSGYGMTNLDVNYKIVGRGGPKAPDEEIVAASLIWDFLDGKNAIDQDGIEMAHSDFWKLFRANYTYSNGTSGPVSSLADLYEALNSTSGNGFHDDYDSDGMDNLDELFVAHGIFQDDDGDLNYTEGERIGVTLAKGQGNQSAIRRKVQPAAGTYLGIGVKSDSGKDIDSVVRVDVEFGKPYDIYDYTYYVRVPARTEKINLEMPENDYNVTATVSASLPGYSGSTTNYTITNAEYWRKSNAATGEFDSHDFVLEYRGSAYCSSAEDCEAGEECDNGSCKIPPEGVCGSAFLLPMLLCAGFLMRAREPDHA